MPNELILVLLGYAIIGTIIAYFAKGGKTQEEYYIANRSLSGAISALTYAATTYSAFMMVGLVGLAYMTGVGATGFELMYFVGTLFLLSYYAPKIWHLSKEKGIISPTEFLKLHYGERTAKIATIVALVALIPYTSVQLIGVALILETAGVNYIHGIIITAFLVCLWAFIGGLRGVAWTDAIQGIVMLLAAITTVLYISSKINFLEFYKLGDLLYVPNRFWSFKKFVALVLPWFFFALTNPQVFQRLFIPKNERALKRMVVLFGLFGLLYTFLVTILGLELRLLTENNKFPQILDRDKVTPTLLAFLPLPICLIVSLSILAAALTTANSIILSLSSMISRDVVSEKGIMAGRISLLVLTFATAIFAISRPEYIVELAVLSSTILLCQLPLILGSLHFQVGDEITGTTTIIIGFLTATLTWYFNVSVLNLPNSVTTFIVSFSIYLILTLSKTILRRQ